jgi:hypothetical protein
VLTPFDDGKYPDDDHTVEASLCGLVTGHVGVNTNAGIREGNGG